MTTLANDRHYKLMPLLEANPGVSQRETARVLRVTVRTVDYCAQTLILVGHVTAVRFKNSPIKAAYSYSLTPREPRGSGSPHEFLQVKMLECEALRAEIEQLH